MYEAVTTLLALVAAILLASRLTKMFAHGPTITMDDRSQAWLSETYYAGLTEKLNASIEYLHSAIAWSITLTVAGVSVILTQARFPNERSLVLGVMLSLFLNHFGVRAAKGYLNVVRFAAIQRRLTAWQLSRSEGDLNRLIEHIRSLDLAWCSPVRKRVVLYKIIFECGYGYFYALTIGTIIYTLATIQATVADILLTIAGAVVQLLELYFGLLRSPYLRTIARDEIAELYR
jgi:hypothetical protein